MINAGRIRDEALRNIAGAGAGGRAASGHGAALLARTGYSAIMAAFTRYEPGRFLSARLHFWKFYSGVYLPKSYGWRYGRCDSRDLFFVSVLASRLINTGFEV